MREIKLAPGLDPERISRDEAEFAPFRDLPPVASDPFLFTADDLRIPKFDNDAFVPLSPEIVVDDVDSVDRPDRSILAASPLASAGLSDLAGAETDFLQNAAIQAERAFARRNRIATDQGEVLPRPINVTRNSQIRDGLRQFRRGRSADDDTSFPVDRVRGAQEAPEITLARGQSATLHRSLGLSDRRRLAIVDALAQFSVDSGAADLRNRLLPGEREARELLTALPDVRRF